MALILMDGFDAGDYALKWYNIGAVASSATTRFTSGRSISISNAVTYRPFSASNQVYLGFTLSSSNIDAAVRPYIVLYGDNGTTAHLSLGYANNTLNLYRGSLGTIIASYAATFVAGTWYAIELAATVADAGGTCVVKLNGATVINFTGDTKNGGTNTTMDMIGFGSNGGYTAYLDDLYICDGTGSAPHNSFLGDVRIRTVTPTAAGSSTQFTPSTGANYTTVDELPYSATDYVSSKTSGQRDTYAMADVPNGMQNILAVQNNLIAKKTDAASAAIKPALKSGASVYYGATSTLLASDKVVTDIRTSDPATAAAWTDVGVNALEAGFEVA